jgi:hypothetical protein
MFIFHLKFSHVCLYVVSVATNKVLRQPASSSTEDGRNLCTLCEEIIKAIDSSLSQNRTQADVEKVGAVWLSC